MAKKVIRVISAGAPFMNERQQGNSNSNNKKCFFFQFGDFDKNRVKLSEARGYMEVKTRKESPGRESSSFRDLELKSVGNHRDELNPSIA